MTQNEGRTIEQAEADAADYKQRWQQAEAMVQDLLVEKQRLVNDLRRERGQSTTEGPLAEGTEVNG